MWLLYMIDLMWICIKIDWYFNKFLINRNNVNENFVKNMSWFNIIYMYSGLY